MRERELFVAYRKLGGYPIQAVPQGAEKYASVVELGGALVGHRPASFGKVVGQKHRGIPGRDVVQAVGHAVIPTVQKHLLDAPDRERRLGRNRGGDFADAGKQRGPVVEDAIDQANVRRHWGIELPTGVSELPADSVANQLRQAL